MSTARKAVFSSIVGQPLNVLLLLVGTIATTRLLSPDERGVFSGVIAAFTLIQIIQTFGSGVQVTRQQTAKSEINQAATIVWIGCSFSFLLLQLFANPIAELLREPRSSIVIRILSLSCLIAPIEVLFGGQLLKEMRGKEVMLCSLLKSFVAVFTSISAILSGFTYEALAIGFVTASLANSTACYYLVRDNKAWSGFSRPSRDYLARSASLTGFLVAKNASERLIHPAVLTLQGAFSAGILGTSWGILDMAKQVLVDALMMFLTPLLSGHSSDTNTYRFYFERMTAVIGAIVPPAFISAGLLSYELIEVLFGKQWLAAAPIMTIFAFAGALHYSTIGYAEQLISQKKDAEAFRWELLMGLVCLGLFIPALQFGLEVAAWTRVFYSFLVMCLSIYIATKTAKIDIKTLSQIYGVNLVILASTIAPIVLLNRLSMSSGHKLFLCTVLGSATYLVALRFSKHVLFKELTKVSSLVRAKLASRGDFK